MSICYGSEYSKHVGINVLGYESCCNKELMDKQSAVNSQKTSQSSYKSKCNCNDEKIVANNKFQQISTKYTDNNLYEISNINTQISSFTVRFEEKYNKTNWDIYSYKQIDNQLAILKKVVLII
jgi:hypothetical protein